MTRGQIKNIKDIKKFVLGGNSTFTVKNEKTGNHLTFKVKRGKKTDKNPNPPHFVRVLTGQSNDSYSDYTFLGTIFNGDLGTYRLGKRTRISAESRSARVFDWFSKRLLVNTPLPNEFTFYHEGRCGCCGRKLTVPSSIESGIGPVCAGEGRR